MSEAKMMPELDAVFAEIEIAAPPERVFRALTDQKQLFHWWGKEPSVELIQFDMDGRAGGRYRYSGKPVPGSQHGPVHEQLLRRGEEAFICHGEVLECVPPRLLVWSWIANWHEHPTHPTVVRWDLTPTKNGTRVRVTHSGLTQEPVSRKDYTGGWEGVLRLLRTYLES